MRKPIAIFLIILLAISTLSNFVLGYFYFSQKYYIDKCSKYLPYDHNVKYFDQLSPKIKEWKSKYSEIVDIYPSKGPSNTFDNCPDTLSGVIIVWNEKIAIHSEEDVLKVIRLEFVGVPIHINYTNNN